MNNETVGELMSKRNSSALLEFDIQIRGKYRDKAEVRKFFVHECNETDIQIWWNFEDETIVHHIFGKKDPEDAILFCIDEPD